MKPWNASEDAILKSNYGREGVTAEKIGEVLGRTRNSVIGRAHGLGLSKPDPHLRKRKKDASKTVEREAVLGELS